MKVIKKYEKRSKTLCVFGVLNTQRGNEIAEEMLSWLTVDYDVDLILHDGSDFEYPAMKYAFDKSAHNNEPVLYVHSKGAFNKSYIADCTRKLWRKEFVDNKEWYINCVSVNTPKIACPFTGKKKTTWLNGFIANSEASAILRNLSKTRNRYYYETLPFHHKGVAVEGRIMGDVDDNPDGTPNSVQKLKCKKYIYDMGNTKNRNVVYTVVTGSYDFIKQPKVVTPGVDYVIFTDDMTIDSGLWTKREVPKELLGLSKVKQQRCIKICPHKFLPEYDMSIYVDGSIEILSDLTPIFEKVSKSQKTVFIPKHPQRNCIYDEGRACMMLRKDTRERINETIECLKKSGFPRKAGLVQSNVIYRRHNEDYSIKLMDEWWNFLREHSHRDQLSFNYALWKTGNEGFEYIDKTTCNSKYFKWYTSHKKKPSPANPIKRPSRNIDINYTHTSY